MPELTLTLPQELFDKIQKYKEIRWENVAKEIIEKKIRDLERTDQLLEKSNLTVEDVETIAEAVDDSVRKERG